MIISPQNKKQKTTTKDKRKREQTKDAEYLIIYTRHLERRLRNLDNLNEEEKQGSEHQPFYISNDN